MGKTKQPEWNATEYLQRKAKRREQTPPLWFTNPDTGERFFIRPIGAMAFVVAGKMQHILTDDAVEAWQKNGLEIAKADDDEEKTLDQESKELAALIEQGEQHAEVVARIIHEACLIPRVVVKPKAAGEIHIVDLEQSDMFFIFRAATGQASADDAQVALKGGESMKLRELKSVSGKSRKSARTIARG